MQAQHPEPGDCCLGCIHKPDPHEAHYFALPGGMPFKRPDGSSDVAKWLLVCGGCFIRFKGDITGALERKELPVATDMVWPKNLSVIFKTPS